MKLDLPWLVEDRHRRLVILALADVVDVDQVTEDLDGVGPKETGVPGQLLCVGLAAPSQRAKPLVNPNWAFRRASSAITITLSRVESTGCSASPSRIRQLLGEDHLTALRLEQSAKIFDALGVLDIAHQRPGRDELIVQLLVQVRPIDLDHERRVVHRRSAATSRPGSTSTATFPSNWVVCQMTPSRLSAVPAFTDSRIFFAPIRTAKNWWYICPS